MSRLVLNSADLMKYTIGSYLDNNTKKELLLCNKASYGIMKDQILINLNVGKSIRYVLDEDYRARIHKSYKANQLCLSFNCPCDTYEIDQYLRKRLPWIMEIIKDNNGGRLPSSPAEIIIHMLFTKNNIISDNHDVIGIIKNVHTLDLTSTKIIDVSALGGVHTLNLIGTDVTDISALDNVKQLYLQDAQL